MTNVIYVRADGKPAGDPIKLPPARPRRLSSIMKQHSQLRTRPTLAFVVREREMDNPEPLEHNLYMRKRWAHTLVGKRDTVIVMYAPRGGGGGGKGGQSQKGKGASIGLLVATVALAAIGQFWAIGAIAGALGTSTAVAGSIWAVGSMGSVWSGRRGAWSASEARAQAAWGSLLSMTAALSGACSTEAGARIRTPAPDAATPPA